MKYIERRENVVLVYCTEPVDVGIKGGEMICRRSFTEEAPFDLIISSGSWNGGFKRKEHHVYRKCAWWWCDERVRTGMIQ